MSASATQGGHKKRAIFGQRVYYHNCITAISIVSCSAFLRWYRHLFHAAVKINLQHAASALVLEMHIGTYLFARKHLYHVTNVYYLHQIFVHV